MHYMNYELYNCIVIVVSTLWTFTFHLNLVDILPLLVEFQWCVHLQHHSFDLVDSVLIIPYHNLTAHVLQYHLSL